MTTGVPRKHLCVSRVITEDADFITIEVGKRDDVTWHLQQNEEGETVGGDRFLTMMFVHTAEGGGMETWLPWE